MTHNILLTTIIGGGVIVCGVLPGAAAPRQKSFGAFKSFSQQKAHHHPVTAPQVRRVAPQAKVPAARMTARELTPMAKVPAARLGNADRVHAAHQARGLAEARDAVDAFRTMPGFAPRDSGKIDTSFGNDLTKGRGGRLANGFAAGMAHREGQSGNSGYENPHGDLMPDLPSNNSYGAGLRPSGNIRDHMGGAAGKQDSGSSVPPTVLHPRPQNNAGTTTETVPETGTVTRTTRYVDDEGRSTGVHQVSRHSDGSKTVLDTHIAVDGSGHARYRNYDSSGRETDEAHFDLGNVDRTQDPNADTNSGGIMAPWIDVRPSHVANPTKVNPGTAENLPGPQAPRINPGQSILVNPSLTENAGPDRALDPATARRMFEAALPDPGGRPPRPE